MYLSCSWFIEAAAHPGVVIVAVAVAAATAAAMGLLLLWWWSRSSSSAVAEQKRAAIGAVILQSMGRRHSNHRPGSNASAITAATATAVGRAASVSTTTPTAASSQSSSRCHRHYCSCPNTSRFYYFSVECESPLLTIAHIHTSNGDTALIRMVSLALQSWNISKLSVAENYASK